MGEGVSWDVRGVLFLGRGGNIAGGGEIVGLGTRGRVEQAVGTVKGGEEMALGGWKRVVGVFDSKRASIDEDCFNEEEFDQCCWRRVTLVSTERTESPTIWVPGHLPTHSSSIYIVVPRLCTEDKL